MAEPEYYARLKQIYTAPDQPGALGGVDRLYEQAKSEGVDVNRKQVVAFLKTIDAYTLHKPYRKKYTRNKTIVGGIDKQWQCDLADLNDIVDENDGYRYILTCIDCFSKYAWAIPVKSKAALPMANAFRELFTETHPRVPTRLQTDKGTEFLNKVVRALFKEKGIHHFVTEGDTKAAIVERFNRTIKTKMWRYFTAKNTLRYLEVLPKLLHAYNHSKHRTIGMRPVDVTPDKENEIWRRVYGDKPHRPTKAAFDEGEQVRISKMKRTFEKGYLPNWTDEFFTVSEKVDHDKRLYKLVDYEGDPILGTFYKEELQGIVKTDTDTYQVEKILRRRRYRGNKELLIKWKGWPDKFNSWVPEADLENVNT